MPKRTTSKVISRLHAGQVRGVPARHFVPYDAEIAPEDEGGQWDEKQDGGDQWAWDSAPEE